LHLGRGIAELQYVAALATQYEFETQGPAIGPIPAEGILRREPLGVVAAIVPWNIPLLTAVWKIAPALVTGNTVVLKPDEHAPLVLLELAQEFEAAGLPRGVFNVVVGDGEPVGAHLSGHPDVRKVGFTGSTVVGKSIVGKSAETLKRVTLELGGKGPNILLPDADLDVAIDGALFACFANNGQACEAGTRLLVPRDRHPEIIERLVARGRTLVLGDPLDPTTTVGPIITRAQQQRILGFLQSAKDSGAKIVLGGNAPSGAKFEKGNWVEPTIVTDVTNDQPIARDEVFGPVLVVLTYDSLEEAIAIANDTHYGLSAGVWSKDEAKALEVARQLEAGMVYVNDWHVIHPAYPFGGYKQSGLGREGGPDSLDEYTEQKYISLNRSASLAERAFAIVIDPPQVAS